MGNVPYTKEWYQYWTSDVRQSARQIVPLLIEWIKPRSVIDVGCGSGEWLAEFYNNGVTDILGVDGPWVDYSVLSIKKELFLQHDLTVPLTLHRSFDLVISLEVAEHLPEQASEMFINGLTALAPVILFSAAIPYQGGDNHQNEQWASYWIAAFEKKKYVVVDCLRPRIWTDQKISFFYRQNMMFFVYEEALTKPSIKIMLSQSQFHVHDLVCPTLYLQKVKNKSSQKGPKSLQSIFRRVKEKAFGKNRTPKYIKV